jgi:hypothetical protein
MNEQTKRVIDWLTLIPIGFLPASRVWIHYTHTENSRASALFIVLAITDIPLILASFIWLGLRTEKIKLVRWLYYNIIAIKSRGLLFFIAWVFILVLIKRLWR